MIILHNYSGTQVVFLMIHALPKEHWVQFRWCKENREEDLSLILSPGDWPTKPFNMDLVTSSVPLSSMPMVTQSAFPPSRIVPCGCAWTAGRCAQDAPHSPAPPLTRTAGPVGVLFFLSAVSSSFFAKKRSQCSGSEDSGNRDHWHTPTAELMLGQSMHTAL